VHRQTGIATPALPPDRPAPTAARYHRAGDPWPLYASLDPETVWAEWAAATRGAIDPSAERRRLWRIDVNGLRVVDLRRPAARDELGVEVSDLVGARRAAQSLSAKARALGADGMIVPSAAHADHWNLVVFPAAFAKLRVAGSTATRPRPPA
jgi:RES domain-containing protein